MKTKFCKYCDGLGFYQDGDKFRVCPECDGAGEIEINFFEEIGNDELKRISQFKIDVSKVGTLEKD